MASFKKFGGKWTVGIGVTERGCVDLVFEPVYERKMELPLGSLGRECASVLAITAAGSSMKGGANIRIKNLIGSTEEMRASW